MWCVRESTCACDEDDGDDDGVGSSLPVVEGRIYASLLLYQPVIVVFVVMLLSSSSLLLSLLIRLLDVLKMC